MYWRTRKRGTRKQRGKRFPIRSRKRYVKSRPILRLETPKDLGKSLVKATLNAVLHQTPIIGEIGLAYSIADSLYDNWSSIKELYDKCKKEGLTGLVNDKAVLDAISSIQTDIVWRNIKEHVPNQFQDIGFKVLSNVVDKITDEEIRYVKRFLR